MRFKILTTTKIYDEIKRKIELKIMPFIGYFTARKSHLIDLYTGHYVKKNMVDIPLK